MMKRILPITLVLALILSGCGSGGSSVNLKSEGFKQLQTYKEGDAKITTYSGNVSTAKASEVFNDWALGEGWEKSSDSISFAGYSGQMFEKGKEVMMINIIDTGVAVSVSVTVVKSDAEQSQSTPKPSPTSETKNYIGYDSIFDISDTYKELECVIDETSMNYIFYGRETIDGVETEHIQITSDGNVIEVWVDENSENVLKAKSDGEEVLPEQAYGANMLVSYLDLFFTGGAWDSSWEDFEKADTSRNLGSGQMKITSYTIKFPGVPGGTVTEVGETGNGLIVVSVTPFDDDGNYQSGLELKKLIER